MINLDQTSFVFRSDMNISNYMQKGDEVQLSLIVIYTLYFYCRFRDSMKGEVRYCNIRWKLVSGYKISILLIKIKQICYQQLTYIHSEVRLKAIKEDNRR